MAENPWVVTPRLGDHVLAEDRDYLSAWNQQLVLKDRSTPSDALVAQAVQRGATIVATRGVHDWSVAVPSLMGYRRLVRTSSQRRAIVSQGNLVEDGWEKVVDALDLDQTTSRWSRV
jgi:hypothetical protein